MSTRDPSPPAPEELLAHAGFVRALSRRLLQDTHRAEDLVQETWLAAIRKPPKPERSLGAWLSGVVRNLAAKAHRREARRERREAEASPVRQPEDPANLVARLELARFVVDEVQKLDEPYRSAIVNRYFDDLPPREIARRRDVPVETVRTWIGRGIVKLRGRLNERHGLDREAWRGLLLPFVPSLAGVGAPLVSTTSKLAAAAVTLLLAGTAGVVLHDPSAGPRGQPVPASESAYGPTIQVSPSTVNVPRATRSEVVRPATVAREPRVHGSAYGRIRFRDGRTPQDALVVFERLYRDGDDPGGPTRFELATGPDGGFGLEALPPGPYRISARARGGYSGYGKIEVPSGGSTPAVEVTLHHGAEVVVRVLDSAGLPVRDVPLRIRAAGMNAAGRTDMDGHLIVDGLPGGHVSVTRSDPSGASRRTRSLRLGRDESVQMIFRDDCSLRGVVRRPVGEPTGPIEVVLRPEAPRDGALDVIRATVDAAGGYRVAALDAGTYVAVVESSGSRRWQALAGHVRLEPMDDKRMDLGVGPGRLSGRVRAPSGGPPDAPVEIRFQREGRPTVFAWPDQRGDYEVFGLDPGEWRVQVHLPGFGDVERLVDLGPSGVAEGVDFDVGWRD